MNGAANNMDDMPIGGSGGGAGEYPDEYAP